MRNMLSFFLTLLFSIIIFEGVSCEIFVSFCPPLKNTLVPYPGNCTKFIKCNNGYSTIFDCNIGSVFSSKLNQCISSQKIDHCQDIKNTSQNFQVYCPRYSNGRFPHPFNCKKFITCNYGFTYTMDCALGTVYNPLTADCDWPRNVPECLNNSGNSLKLRKDVPFFFENSQKKRFNFRIRNNIDGEKKHQKIINNKHEYSDNRTYQINGLKDQLNNKPHQGLIHSKNNVKNKTYHQPKNSLEGSIQIKYSKQNKSSADKFNSKDQLRSFSNDNHPQIKPSYNQTKQQPNYSTQNVNNVRNQLSNHQTNKTSNLQSTEKSNYIQTTVLHEQPKNRKQSTTPFKYAHPNQQLNKQNNSSIDAQLRNSLAKTHSKSSIQTRYGKHNQQINQKSYTNNHSTPIHNDIGTILPSKQQENQSILFDQMKNSQQLSTGHQIHVTSNLPTSLMNDYARTTVSYDQLKNQGNFSELNNQSGSSTMGNQNDFIDHASSAPGINHVQDKHTQLKYQKNTTAQTVRYYQKPLSSRPKSVKNRSSSISEKTNKQTTAFSNRLDDFTQIRNKNRDQLYSAQAEADSTKLPKVSVSKFDSDRKRLHDGEINKRKNLQAQIIKEGRNRSSIYQNDVTTPTPALVTTNGYQTTYYDQLKNQVDLHLRSRNGSRSTIHQNEVTTDISTTITEDYYETTTYPDQPENHVDYAHMKSQNESRSTILQNEVTTDVPTIITEDYYETATYREQPENRVDHVYMKNQSKSQSTIRHNEVTIDVPTIITEDYYETTTYRDQPETHIDRHASMHSENKSRLFGNESDITIDALASVTNNYYQATSDRDQPDNQVNWHAHRTGENQNYLLSHIPSTITENYYQPMTYNDLSENEVYLRARMRDGDQYRPSSFASDVTTDTPLTVTENYYQTTKYYNQSKNGISSSNQSDHLYQNQLSSNDTNFIVYGPLNSDSNHIKENLPYDQRDHINSSRDINPVDQHFSIILTNLTSPTDSTYPTSYFNMNQSDHFSDKQALNDQSKYQSTPAYRIGFSNSSKCSHVNDSIVISVDQLDNFAENISLCKDYNNIRSLVEKTENEETIKDKNIESKGNLSISDIQATTINETISVLMTNTSFEINNLDKIDTSTLYSKDKIQLTNGENKIEHTEHQSPDILKKLYYDYNGINELHGEAIDFHSPFIIDERIVNSSENRLNDKFWKLIDNHTVQNEDQIQFTSIINKINSTLSVMNGSLNNNTVIENLPTDYYYYYTDHANISEPIDKYNYKTRNHTNTFIVNSEKVEDQTLIELNQKSSSIKKIFSEKADNTSISTFFITPFKSTNEKQHTKEIDQLSGQILRLWGRSDTYYGYVEIRGIGLVGQCDNSWDLKKASKVCKKLGYKRGAEISWKGSTNDTQLSLSSLENNIICQDNTAEFHSCAFTKHAKCSVERHTVGVKCFLDSSDYCNKNEVSFQQNCYHLVNSSLDLNHDDAIEYCSSKNSSLLYITAQAENDFISEWLSRKYPQVDSIMTAGIGFTTLGHTIWAWQDSSKSLFNFIKWWPGWKNERQLPPFTKSKISCVVMKNKFPCYNQPHSSCETDGYFFWDVEDCATSMRGNYYICKRPYSNIIYK